VRACVLAPVPACWGCAQQQGGAGAQDAQAVRGKLLQALQGIAVAGAVGSAGGAQGGAGAGAGAWPAQLLKQQGTGGGGAEAVGSLGALLHAAPSLHSLEQAPGAADAPGARSVWNSLAQQMGIESRVGVGGMVSGGRDGGALEQHDVSQRQQQVAELQQHLAHMMQHNSSAVQLAALANRSFLIPSLFVTPACTPRQRCRATHAVAGKGVLLVCRRHGAQWRGRKTDCVHSTWAARSQSIMPLRLAIRHEGSVLKCGEARDRHVEDELNEQLEHLQAHHQHIQRQLNLQKDQFNAALSGGAKPPTAAAVLRCRTANCVGRPRCGCACVGLACLIALPCLLLLDCTALPRSFSDAKSCASRGRARAYGKLQDSVTC